MAVALMATAHLECKISLSLKPCSVILREASKIKLRKDGRRPGCFRKISRFCGIYHAIPGISRDTLSVHPPPLSSGCPDSRGTAPAAAAAPELQFQQCSWRRFLALLGTAAASAPAGRGMSPAQAQQQHQGWLCTQARIIIVIIIINLNNFLCQAYLSSRTPHKLPPPSTRE